MISMDQLGLRKNMVFHIPTRGIIGLRSRMMTATAGEAVISHRFVHYAPYMGRISHRNNGVMISMGNGKSLPFALDGLQLRGSFFIEPGVECYEGMIVGEHCLDKDLLVNVQKAKQLTNMRASGSERAMKIAPAQKISLEEALEYIKDDELVEVTPKHVRMRKRFLTDNERKRMKRAIEGVES
jgi:GTP-binding protein